MHDVRTPVRVMLADEHALFREAVRVVLEAEPDIHVVGDVSDGFQAATEARRTRPDCVLLDAGLHQQRVLRHASHQGRRARSATSSSWRGRRIRTRSSRRSRLSQRLSHEGAPLEELIEAVRAVHRGETLVPPQMLGALVSGLIRRRKDQEEALAGWAG